MSSQEHCFTRFQQAIDTYTLPERFTFPFYYQPHPLCLLAAQELQQYLTTQQQWQHNFGVDNQQNNAIGKMFGVLLVQNKAGEIGYLAAFSGKIAEQNHWSKFVPPVFDMLAEESFFIAGQAQINQLSEQIKRLEKNPQILDYQTQLNKEISASEMHIGAQRKHMIESRKIRKARRLAAATALSADEFQLLQAQLSQDSIKEKLQRRDLNIYWRERIQTAEANLEQLRSEITTLKDQRRDLSAALQKKIFDQYRFLNSSGTSKSLYDIFQETPQLTPPAGSGECAAPKLLHYAFQQGMKPLAMAEFWWGKSPKSEIRKHLNFYPACQGKCQPILKHMLAGMQVDANPLLNNPAAGKSIDIIYQDADMLVINKPAEFLSVPGKQIDDSVYLRMQQRYPDATGPLIVHRLDMSTSGLMLIALSKQSHKSLQKQFIKRTVKKRYVALLEGVLKADAGIIDLPLRVDLDDRPRQLVCYEQGKPAKTQWQVIARKHHQTKVYFYPITGRTHQLRVHAAHAQGLNAPILGDDLYGQQARRLHLHAESIEFTHPTTRELMHFQLEEDF